MTAPFSALKWSPIVLSILVMPLSGQETPEKWYDSGRQRVERNLSLRQESDEVPIACLLYTSPSPRDRG